VASRYTQYIGTIILVKQKVNQLQQTVKLKEMIQKHNQQNVTALQFQSKNS
jgi:hypothetical protein